MKTWTSNPRNIKVWLAPNMHFMWKMLKLIHSEQHSFSLLSWRLRYSQTPRRQPRFWSWLQIKGEPSRNVRRNELLVRNHRPECLLSYISQKGKGDVKKTGKLDPYAYIPLKKAQLNRRYESFCNPLWPGMVFSKSQNNLFYRLTGSVRSCKANSRAWWEEPRRGRCLERRCRRKRGKPEELNLYHWLDLKCSVCDAGFPNLQKLWTYNMDVCVCFWQTVTEDKTSWFLNCTVNRVDVCSRVHVWDGERQRRCWMCAPASKGINWKMEKHLSIK